MILKLCLFFFYCNHFFLYSRIALVFTYTSKVIPQKFGNWPGMVLWLKYSFFHGLSSISTFIHSIIFFCTTKLICPFVGYTADIQIFYCCTKLIPILLSLFLIMLI